MWNNEDWAKRHIKKHRVTPKEAWEVVFEGAFSAFLRSPDQLNFPPYTRYWTIGETREGRLLMVVWERYREELNLITAFDPGPKRIELYEKLTKKRR